MATKCDGMHGLLANSYFNTPYADIGYLLFPPKECKRECVLRAVCVCVRSCAGQGLVVL